MKVVEPVCVWRPRPTATRRVAAKNVVTRRVVLPPALAAPAPAAPSGSSVSRLAVRPFVPGHAVIRRGAHLFCLRVIDTPRINAPLCPTLGVLVFRDTEKARFHLEDASLRAEKLPGACERYTEKKTSCVGPEV